jgi:hypothetical protein
MSAQAMGQREWSRPWSLVLVGKRTAVKRDIDFWSLGAVGVNSEASACS